MKIVEFNGLKLTMGVKEKIQLEKALGCSPLNFIFSMLGGTIEGDVDLANMKIPPLPVMVEILFQASTKLNHGISREKFMDMLDAYLEVDEHSIMNLFSVCIEVLQASKYLPTVEQETVEAVEE